MDHFVHAMQFYLAALAASRRSRDKVLIPGRHHSPYIRSFLLAVRGIPGVHIADISFHEISKHPHRYDLKYVRAKEKLSTWDGFNAETTRLIRDHILGPSMPRSVGFGRVGIVNRTFNRATGAKSEYMSNRILLNAEDLKSRVIDQLNLQVDLVNFDDKTFQYQARFFREHDIIISPHGAQLASIPFMGDNGLVIEISSKEYYVDYYFRDLAVLSGKSHLFMCSSHSAEETNRYDEVGGLEAARATDVEANIGTIIAWIKKYMKTIVSKGGTFGPTVEKI